MTNEKRPAKTEITVNTLFALNDTAPSGAGVAAGGSVAATGAGVTAGASVAATGAGVVAKVGAGVAATHNPPSYEPWAEETQLLPIPASVTPVFVQSNTLQNPDSASPAIVQLEHASPLIFISQVYTSSYMVFEHVLLS
jgi:hypothetical protein